MLEAGPHTLVQLAPPLPGPQLLVLLAGLQGEAVSLGLGRQVRRALLSLLHQGAEVGLPALHARNCNGTEDAARVSHADEPAEESIFSRGWFESVRQGGGTSGLATVSQS